MARSGRKIRTRERAISAAILVLLVAIAGVLAWQQGDYDPERYRGPQTLAVASARTSAGSGDFFGFTPPAELRPTGAMHVFDADNLYEKIDGKADLYLSAGFVALRCRRFAAGFEACVYDMGSRDGAFSVWSRQRRDDAAPVVGLPGEAYATTNALFLAAGSHYLELVSAGADAAATQARLAFARAFAAQFAPAKQAAPSVALPVEGLREGNVKLVLDSALGFARFDHVYVGWYGEGDDEAAGFLSRRASADEASELAAAFAEFLSANGATPAKVDAAETDWPPGVRLLEVYGTWTAVWARGPLLLGVHEAASRPAARQLAARLDQIREEAP